MIYRLSMEFTVDKKAKDRLQYRLSFARDNDDIFG